MKIQIINKSEHPLPSYQTAGAVAVDLTANVEGTEEVVILPHSTALIGTGIHIAIPHGYEAQIRSRSGMAQMFGIAVLNSPGTIDSDYRGEIRVLLINHSMLSFTINNGDRIAQMVFSKCERAEFEEVEVLPDTERGSGGFGSTGINTAKEATQTCYSDRTTICDCKGLCKEK